MTKKQYMLDNYEEHRRMLKTGDVLVCNGTGLPSKIIRAVTKRLGLEPASHVGVIVVLNEFDRVMVAESLEGVGVRFVRLSSYLNNYSGSGKPYNGELKIVRHKEYKYDHKWEYKLVKFVLDNQGHRYSVRQVISIFWRLARKRMPLRILEKVESYICSEFVEVCLQALNLYVLKDDSKRVSLPNDFNNPLIFKLVVKLK